MNFIVDVLAESNLKMRPRLHKHQTFKTSRLLDQRIDMQRDAAYPYEDDNSTPGNPTTLQEVRGMLAFKAIDYGRCPHVEIKMDETATPDRFVNALIINSAFFNYDVPGSQGAGSHAPDGELIDLLTKAAMLPSNSDAQMGYGSRGSFTLKVPRPVMDAMIMSSGFQVMTGVTRKGTKTKDMAPAILNVLDKTTAWFGMTDPSTYVKEGGDIRVPFTFKEKSCSREAGSSGSTEPLGWGSYYTRSHVGAFGSFKDTPDGPSASMTRADMWDDPDAPLVQLGVNEGKYTGRFSIPSGGHKDTIWHSREGEGDMPSGTVGDLMRGIVDYIDPSFTYHFGVVTPGCGTSILKQADAEAAANDAAATATSLLAGSRVRACVRDMMLLTTLSSARADALAAAPLAQGGVITNDVRTLAQLIINKPELMARAKEAYPTLFAGTALTASLDSTDVLRVLINAAVDEYAMLDFNEEIWDAKPGEENKQKQGTGGNLTTWCSVGATFINAFNEFPASLSYHVCGDPIENAATESHARVLVGDCSSGSYPDGFEFSVQNPGHSMDTTSSAIVRNRDFDCVQWPTAEAGDDVQSAWIGGADGLPRQVSVNTLKGSTLWSIVGFAAGALTNHFYGYFEDGVPDDPEQWAESWYNDKFFLFFTTTNGGA